ncbi:MAG TPA: Uma2 family endonuclease [Candidatus Lokiarchaeia archaeon]|nr:Uma2 family endonuclease [Candidatus Lokiarchaeia archaeon]
MVKLGQDKVINGDFIILQQDVSEEEFYAFCDEDIKCELLDRVLVIQSPANPEHEDIFGFLFTLLRLYLKNTGKGKVFGSRLAVHLSKEWNPEPDILVIAPSKYENLTEGRLEGPPDLVIEILSKSTRDNDEGKKLQAYLHFGVQEIWIVNPMEKTITIHTHEGTQTWDDSDQEEIVNSSVLEPFFIKIRWMWNREEFSEEDLIKEILSQ